MPKRAEISMHSGYMHNFSVPEGKTMVFNTDPTTEEKDAREAAERRREIINVLAEEYNAVYYCNAVNHEYDIVYQQGFVREELNKMLKALPKFENAFNFYVKNFVHPDDQDMMYEEINKFTKRLAAHKSYTVPFRRSYDGRYLYTEMYCVKIGEADDELKYFVVGFKENDSNYHNIMDQQKQLEIAINERTSELQERNSELNKLNEDVVELLANLTEARDLSSGEHIRRVKGFTGILAKQVMNDWPEYKLTEDTVSMIISASALHDIGKIAIPDSILLKTGKLTDDEMEIMKTHCEKGCELLRNAPKGWSNFFLQTSMDICRCHHEKYDGNGYPAGLVGDEIPISAQIVSIVDCFDALTSKRVYKNAIDYETSINMILGGECGVFSDKLLSSFTACKTELLFHAMNPEKEFTLSAATSFNTNSLSWVKILLVDDNELGRDLCKNILESEGAEVTTASGGKEALDLFCSNEPFTFDAILMDVMMPGMNGIEVTEKIRASQREDASSVTILALTALNSSNDVNLCLDAGMDSFITKPISISKLSTVLLSCLQSHRDALGTTVEHIQKKAAAAMESAIRESSLAAVSRTGFDFVCYIDGQANDVTCYRASEEFEKIIQRTEKRLPNNRRLDQMFQMLIPEKDFKRFLEDVNRKHILNYLATHSAYHVFVPMIMNGRETNYRLRIVAAPRDRGCFVLAIQSIDSEINEDMRSRDLISRLAEIYEMVDYVDFEKDSYIRYQNTDDEGNYGSNTGCFSMAVQSYIETCVCEEDRKLLTERTAIGRLRRDLSENKRVTLKFREIKNGVHRYCEVQFINADDGQSARFAIVLLADIDAEVRRDNENDLIRTQLRKAEEMARRDTLTGVKNIAAYTDAVSVLAKRLDPTTGIHFGVVMCDIDNLKQVNDSFGHDVGDVYIRNCCRIICTVFSLSPVYRIGGDEFVVILSDEDYENREVLMQKLSEKIAEAERLEDFSDGKASLSAGIADYDGSIDSSVADVIKRADQEMYKNKAERKMR